MYCDQFYEKVTALSKNISVYLLLVSTMKETKATSNHIIDDFYFAIKFTVFQLQKRL